MAIGITRSISGQLLGIRNTLRERGAESGVVGSPENVARKAGGELDGKRGGEGGGELDGKRGGGRRGGGLAGSVARKGGAVGLRGTRRERRDGS